MSQLPYEPNQYWGERLAKNFTLEGVGYQGLGLGMNYWIYRRRGDVVRNLLRTQRVSLEGLDVAEIGVGTGHWIPTWRRLGARSVLGCDITEVSIQRLRSLHPDCTFVRCDVGAPSSLQEAVGDRRFDFIGAMEVLLHLIDERQFKAALDNIVSVSRNGSWLLLSDLFLPVEFRGFQQVCRTLQEYRIALEERGFRLVDRRPVFFFLHPAHFTRRGLLRRAAKLRWRLAEATLRLVPSLGWGVGMLGYALDSLRGRITRSGPSTHLTLWRRA